ncbi:MAG: cofactor assembly of complex C subunit B [Cyanobacteria bacterium J06628_6]
MAFADTATPVLSSTFLLTLLLAVGLFFFIRAATKDRTQIAQFTAEQPAEALREQVLRYFLQRAYRPVEPATEAAKALPDEGWLQLVGQVRPSFFLAIFLGGLAAVGGLCLGLVLSILFPQQSVWFLGLVAIAPLAVLFYWQRAGREEAIAFRVADAKIPNAKISDAEVSDGNGADSAERPQAELTFKGHRDEIIQMAANLPITKRET